MISSHASIVLNAPGVNPKLVQIPVLLNQNLLVSTIHEALPVDDFASPGLVVFDGGSQSSPPFSPQSYGYFPFSPQHGPGDYDPLSSPSTSTSSLSPSLPATRVLAEASCAGAKPVKQKGGGYHCSACGKPFKRRDDAKRHIDSTGMRVECKYCGKPSSGRRDGRVRHLKNNKACLELWGAGFAAGLFTERSVEDAFY